MKTTVLTILMFLFIFISCGDSKTDTIVTIAEIPGVTAPVYGATPVTVITETDQYTGTVSWSDSPATFAASTVYTTTITLTAKSGYTLTGVTADFFTVAGAASVTNSADSGVITAVFPVTTFLFNKLNNLGGTATEQFNSIIEKSGGGYIAVGFSESDLSGLTGGTNTVAGADFVIAEFDADLDLVKINNLGGTGYDTFYSVIEKSGGGYIAVGFSSSDLSGLTGGTNTAGNDDFVIAEFDTDLDLVEINNLGGTGTDYFESVIEKSGGGFIAVGRSGSDLSGLTGGAATAGSDDLVIAEFDADLDLVKINNLGGTNNEYLKSVIEKSGGGYIAVGYSLSDLSGLTGGSNTAGIDDFVIAEFDTDLDLVKINNLGGADLDSFKSVIEKSGGGYIALGYSKSDLSGLTGGTNTAGVEDFVIAEFDANLDLVKINNLGGTSTEYFESIVEKSGGGYIAVGYSASDLSGLTGGSTAEGNDDFVIAEFDTNLDLVKLDNLGGASWDFFRSVTIKNGGGYIAVGHTVSDLSGLTGGTDTAGGHDFVIVEF